MYTVLPLAERVEIAIKKLERWKVIILCPSCKGGHQRLFGKIDDVLSDETIIAILREYIHLCSGHCSCNCNILDQTMLYGTNGHSKSEIS